MTLELKIIPPVQLLICSGLMGLLSKYFPQFSFNLSISFSFAIFLVCVSIIIGALALYDFHKHQTTFHPHTPEKTRTVVNTGVFAYSRNPMYLAMAIALFALGIYLQNYSCFIIMPLFVWYITRFQITPEEKMLDKLFPNDYQAYCQRVRRWL